MSALVLALLGTLGGEALAEQSLPGPALVLPRCRADPEAGCWADAPVLERFQAHPGLVLEPRAARVRLAWDKGAVILWAEALPEGSAVELSVSRGADERLNTAETGRFGPGMHRLPVRGLAAGSEHALKVGLWETEDGGQRTLPWVPAGPVDLALPLPTLLVEAPEPRTVQVSHLGQGVQIAAPGAALSLTHHLPDPGPLGRGGVGAWSAEGEGELRVELPPETGWYLLEARWGAEHLDARWLYLQAPLVDGALELGLVPAPRVATLQGGAAVSLSPRARVVLPAEGELPRASAALLARELERVAGRRLPVVEGPARRGDLRLVRPEEVPNISPEALALAREPEGFALHTGPAGALVVATDAAGFTYGSLALVDLFGTDGRAPRVTVGDAPEVALRGVVHLLNPRQHHLDLDEYRAFLDRVVARGRFNLLFLHVGGAVRLESAPDLAQRGAADPELYRQIVREARALGVDVAPGLQVPAHAEWITQPRPWLAEDNDGDRLCLRHPETYPLLDAMYEELIEIFEQPRWFHVAHDELRWRTDRKPGELRCPRCQGTPRVTLFHETLAHHADFFAARGVTPVIWSDMLVEGWNGAAEGTHRAVALLTEAQRASLRAMSWAPLGDSMGELTAQGLPVIRGYTGYLDHKRATLPEELDRMVGETVGIFTATPLSTWTFSRGDRALNHHWGSVLLAGATAWRPELVAGRVRPTLLGLADSTSARPGLRALPGGRQQALEPRGEPVGAGVIDAAWPEALVAQEVRFGAVRPRLAREGAPVELLDGARRLGALSLLQATRLGWDAEARLRDTLNSHGALGGQPVAALVVEHADGQISEVALRYGVETDAPDGDLRRTLLWGSAGVARLASRDAARLGASPAEGELRLYRLDWVNPRPEVPVVSARLESRLPGVHLIVGAAESWSP